MSRCLITSLVDGMKMRISEDTLRNSFFLSSLFYRLVFSLIDYKRRMGNHVGKLYRKDS